MKRILLITIALISLSSFAFAQEGQQKSLIIINGMFFSEKPEPTPCDVPIQMGVLKDDVFGKIAIMNYDEPMSQEAMALAIPVDQIENGADILERSKSVMTFATVMSGDNLNIKVGDVFPEFKVMDDKGKEWSLQDFNGKMTVINFWYTGCKPCRKEMPELGSWVAKYPEVLFVAVTYESADAIAQIVKDNGFHFHQLVDADALVDAVGVGSYPLTLVLDEESRVILLESGTTPVQRMGIERMIAE